MSKEVENIANRHIGRCLSKIEEVHDLPELCAAAVRKEMHFCANDVAEIFTTPGASRHSEEDETRGNR